MKTSLRARRKWGFIEGTIPTPAENSDDMEDWWTGAIHDSFMDT